MRKIDLIGKKFDRWTVLQESGRNKYGHLLWLCRCDCGKEALVLGDSLRKGKSKSCGCPLKIAVPSREEIETVKKASQNIQDMGRKLHVSASTATKWLKHYNLPTTFRDKYKEAEAEKRQDFTEVETTNFVELHEESGSGKPFSEWIGDPVSLQYGLEQTNPHPTTVPPYKPEDNDNDCEPDGFTEQDDEPIPFVVTTLPEIQPSNYIAEHHQVAEEIAQLLDSKRADYGVENIKKFGSLGCLIRASDKLERLINLRNKEQVNHESIEDTWWDLGGYCILAILELRAGR